MKVTLLDFGMGNLRSVEKALESAGAEVLVTSDPATVETADKLVVPGVGSFPDCMKNLARLKLIEPLKKFVRSGKPYLGICLGMQILFDESEEFGTHAGLGLLKGRVVRFKLPKKQKIPHMGWNRIIKQRRPNLLAEIPDGSYFYFVHSYYVVPEDPNLIVTLTDYGKDFCSSIMEGNLFACQFHPEKSAKLGLTLLRAFVSI